MNIGFTSCKGGQGVTVTACVFALHLATQQENVVLVGGDDAAAVLALPSSGSGSPRLITDNLYFSYTPVEGATNVLDGACGDVTYLVTRPCYLALRRAAGYMFPDHYKGVIVVREPQRALSDNDIASVTRLPVVATLEVDPIVARAVDAGLLTTRLPQSLSPLSRLTIAAAI